MTEAQTQLLIAAREMAQAFVMAVDAYVDSLTTVELDPNAPCPHPEDKRVDCSAMGHPRFICKACNSMVEEGIPV